MVGGLAFGILASSRAYDTGIWGNTLVWFTVPIILASILLPLKLALVMTGLVALLTFYTAQTLSVNAADAIANSLLVLVVVAIITHITQYIHVKIDGFRPLERK